MKTKVLILGSGGREHALAWKLSNDSDVSQVFLHPGNAGTLTAGFASLGDASVDKPEELILAATAKQIDLVVIGPEVLLEKGYADRFRRAGFLVVGPGKTGAQLETSKAFAKAFLEAADIPTARYSMVDSAESLRAAITQLPTVLKLDGLAAGKGVVVATDHSHVDSFISRVWTEKEFGEGPHQVVVEDFISGRELSYIGVCDGTRFIALSSASDYKRLNDRDQGPNTGGMGAISPSPVMSEELETRIQTLVVEPTLRELARQKIEYRGALYFGLMITSELEPYVLEFNARFGDPETQALMLRIETGFAKLLLATAKGELANAEMPTWKPGHAVYVVATAHGYPAHPRKGDAITLPPSLPSGATLFFSGVSPGPKGLLTQGGRVLGVGATGENALDCRTTVYSALSCLSWDGMHFRRDIGLNPSEV